jgi:hypothetical protein
MANSPPPILDSTPPRPEPQGDAQRPPDSSAGGCLIAAGALIGPVVGLIFGQVTIGLLAGLGLGALGAIAGIFVNRQR